MHWKRLDQVSWIWIWPPAGPARPTGGLYVGQLCRCKVAVKFKGAVAAQVKKEMIKVVLNTVREHWPR